MKVVHLGDSYRHRSTNSLASCPSQGFIFSPMIFLLGGGVSDIPKTCLYLVDRKESKAKTVFRSFSRNSSISISASGRSRSSSNDNCSSFEDERKLR